MNIKTEEDYIKLITDKANEKINRICPQLKEDVKSYMVKYILEVMEEMKKCSSTKTTK